MVFCCDAIVRSRGWKVDYRSSSSILQIECSVHSADRVLKIGNLTVPCLLGLLLRSVVKCDVRSNAGDTCCLARYLASRYLSFRKRKAVERLNAVARLQQHIRATSPNIVWCTRGTHGSNVLHTVVPHPNVSLFVHHMHAYGDTGPTDPAARARKVTVTPTFWRFPTAYPLRATRRDKKVNASGSVCFGTKGRGKT